jgi:hypothetical protein
MDGNWLDDNETASKAEIGTCKLAHNFALLHKSHKVITKTLWEILNDKF